MVSACQRSSYHHLAKLFLKLISLWSRIMQLNNQLDWQIRWLSHAIFNIRLLWQSPLMSALTNPWYWTVMNMNVCIDFWNPLHQMYQWWRMMILVLEMSVESHYYGIRFRLEVTVTTSYTAHKHWASNTDRLDSELLILLGFYPLLWLLYGFSVILYSITLNSLNVRIKEL